MNVWKMSGAGNLFAVVDAEQAGDRPRVELARTLCSARMLAADGLIVVHSPDLQISPPVVDVEFFNADGSVAGFCGNGARCVVRFVERRGMAGMPITMRFPGLEVVGHLRGADVCVEVPRPELSSDRPRMGVENARLVDAGVPHVVVDAGPADPPALDALRESIRRENPDLLTQANLTTVARRADRLHVATHELGAGPTQACGSAALAAAAVQAGAGPGFTCTVVPPSGKELIVELEADRARLIGPAEVLYTATIV